MKQLVSKITLWVSVCAVGTLLAASSAQAQNEGISAAAKKMEKHEARRELAALKKYDVNGNGVLDPEEIAAKKADAKAKRDATVLKKYDANGNGALDPDEQAALDAATKAKHDAVVLKKYDRNHNGVLDPDELAAKQANDQKMQVLRDAKNKKISGNKTAPSVATAAGDQM